MYIIDNTEIGKEENKVTRHTERMYTEDTYTLAKEVYDYYLTSLQPSC